MTMLTRLLAALCGLAALAFAPGAPAAGPPTAHDIVDLVESGAVEVQAQGGGIESLRLRLRATRPGPLKVNVPIGTFFVADNTSTQDMIARAASTVTLSGTKWVTLDVAVACANRPRDVPDGNDTFKVQRSPHQDELQRLMPRLRAAGVGFAVEQAAVWIVTDDANFDDLGVLEESSFPGIDGRRVIDERDAARAMQIVDGAGVDITVKSIWADRAAIRKALPAGALRNWLDSRASRP